MSMLDKIRGKFFNKKSFNVGFNNRSPLSYITSTGPSVPSFSDPGLKSFEPGDWAGAYDSSDAVRAETQAEIAKGEGIGGAVWGGLKTIAAPGKGLDKLMNKAEKAVNQGKTNKEMKDQDAIQNFISNNEGADQETIDAFAATL